jgi:diacylglycerol O-acyltransferase
MSLIKQLSREDVMFVAGETDTIYQHVAALAILDTSGRPDFDYEHFRQHCIERAALIPNFHWKLHSVPLGLDRPYWVEDKNFSYDHHIKHIALPQPGDHNTLCEIAAHLYSKHLDRNRPLWEMWLIEGLEGGKYAYLQKFHHCMMDGEGAFKMTEVICDFEPDPPPGKTVDKTISEARPGEVPTFPEQSSKAWSHLAGLPGEAARSAYEILRPKILEQFVWPRKPKEEQPVVPTTCFNQLISGDRAMAFAWLSMSELKKVKSHFAVSLNDVVLAVVSGAIRSYLLDLEALPDEPLRTNIPVSLHTQDDEELSNKVTTTTVTLATNLDDPTARLQAIHRESEQAKEKAHSGAKGIVELFQMMPPIMVSSIMDSLPADRAPQILGANLIVSNVRGSPLPMYIAGARMEAMYPMSILTAGMGINITCISYADGMDCGIIVDPEQVPDHHTIAERLENALSEYTTLCKPVRTKRKPKAAQSKSKPAQKTTLLKKATAKKSAPKSRSSAKTSATTGKRVTTKSAWK